MSSISPPRIREFYLLRKDIGVALVVLTALGLGWLLRGSVENRMTVFQDPASRFRIAYPATWGSVEAPGDVLLKVQDPRTDSFFKTTLTVEARGISSAEPPTLQQLVDRRVAEHGALTGYRFINSDLTTVGGAKAVRQEYAYVVQPIDAPRRAALPVVVDAVEYIVLSQNDVYYITLAAPASDSSNARARLDQLLQSVQMP